MPKLQNNSHFGKTLSSILLKRLKSQTETFISDEQAAFWTNRSTANQILAPRVIAEKAKQKNSLLYNC